MRHVIPTSSGASAPLPASLTLPRLRASAWSAALLCLALLLAWDASGLDLSIVRAIGTAEGFALRQHWLTAQLVHEGGRWLSALGLVSLLLINLLPRRLLPDLSRRERRVWLACTLLSLLLISLIKRVSSTSCPFDLVEFGGVARYISHWQFGLPDGGPGHCFPSGHASSAFAFLSGCFMLRRAYPRAAQAWLIAVLSLGVIYGLGQLLRGAHYPSHTMWTGWICWMAALRAARLLPQTRP